MVSCRTVESTCFELDTTEYIAPSDNNHYLEFFFSNEIDNLLREKSKKLRIDTVSLFSLEGFTREFEEDTFWGVVFFHGYG